MSDYRNRHDDPLPDDPPLPGLQSEPTEANNVS
jgi:hypothetical protein